MGEGGRRPPKLENLNVIYILVFNPFVPKTSLFVQKGLQKFSDGKNVSLSEIYNYRFTICAVTLFPKAHTLVSLEVQK